MKKISYFSQSPPTQISFSLFHQSCAGDRIRTHDFAINDTKQVERLHHGCTQTALDKPVKWYRYQSPWIYTSNEVILFFKIYQLSKSSLKCVTSQKETDVKDMIVTWVLWCRNWCQMRHSYCPCRYTLCLDYFNVGR